MNCCESFVTQTAKFARTIQYSNAHSYSSSDSHTLISKSTSIEYVDNIFLARLIVMQIMYRSQIY